MVGEKNRNLELETFNYSLQDSLWNLYKKEFSLKEDYVYINYTNKIDLDKEKYHENEKVYNSKWIYDKYDNPLPLRDIFKQFLKSCYITKDFDTNKQEIYNFKISVENIIKFFKTDYDDTFILIGLFLNKEIGNKESYIYKAKIID